MNKELKEYSNQELVQEILTRIDEQAMNISILADLFLLVGKIIVEYPYLYQAIIEEIKKRNKKNETN